MSGFGAFDFSSIRSSFGPPSEAVPAPPAGAASALDNPVAAGSVSVATPPPVFAFAATFSKSAFSFIPGPFPTMGPRSARDSEASFPPSDVSMIAISIQHSDVNSLVRELHGASVSQLRSLPEFPVELAVLRASEHRFPFHTPTRLTRKVVTQLREWQARVASHDAAPASSSSAACDSACLSDFHLWLNEYKSTLPARLAAANLVGILGANALSLMPRILECIPSFGWIDFAEQTMQSESVLSYLLRDRTKTRLIEATVKRIERLAALERERISVPSDAPDAAGPLSTAAVISALITVVTVRRPMGHFWVCMPVLRALLSAATAPALIGSAPARIPLLFHELCTLEDDQVMELGALLHEFDIHEDSTGRSLTLHVILSAPYLSRRWFAPANAHISMPLGWLGTQDPWTKFGQPVKLSHPNLAAGARCDVWDAMCRLPLPQEKLIVQHAIDWHYATVTPKLREALSEHLIDDLHAEVMSFLMPPSTLADPPTVPSVALAAVRSWMASLSPEQTEDARRLRFIDHALCLEQINAGFAQRACEAQGQLLMAGAGLR